MDRCFGTSDAYSPRVPRAGPRGGRGRRQLRCRCSAAGRGARRGAWSRRLARDPAAPVARRRERDAGDDRARADRASSTRTSSTRRTWPHCAGTRLVREGRAACSSARSRARRRPRSAPRLRPALDLVPPLRRALPRPRRRHRVPADRLRRAGPREARRAGENSEPGGPRAGTTSRSSAGSTPASTARGSACWRRSASGVELEVWGYGADALPPTTRRCARRYRGEAWGLDMYAVLASRKIASTATSTRPRAAPTTCGSSRPPASARCC